MPTPTSPGRSKQTSSGSSEEPTLSRRRFLAAGLTALGSLVGCASLTPPLRTRTAEPRSPLTIAALEGTQSGLLLRIAWQSTPYSDRLTPADAGQLRLIIERSDDGSAARTVRNQPLDGDLIELLRGDGIRLRDEGLKPSDDSGRPTVYRATLVEQSTDDSSNLARTPLLRLRWPPAPPLPDQPTVDAVTDSSVELSWASRGYATRLFRRNVLRESDESVPVSTFPASDQPQTRFTDTDIESGDVFAYQIAYGTPLEVEIGSKDRTHPSHRRTMRWGPVSEALYVSVK